MRAFMGYSTALPTEEFRSLELLLDDLCRVVTPPVVRRLSDYPPTFVSFGDDEMLRDPIREFIVRLDDVGVPTTTVEEVGMFHVYPFLMPWADASRRVFREVGRFIDDRLPAEP